jgi:hypothetical protein
MEGDGLARRNMLRRFGLGREAAPGPGGETAVSPLKFGSRPTDHWSEGLSGPRNRLSGGMLCFSSD